jgi:hypothetical protein
LTTRFPSRVTGAGYNKKSEKTEEFSKIAEHLFVALLLSPRLFGEPPACLNFTHDFQGAFVRSSGRVWR